MLTGDLAVLFVEWLVVAYMIYGATFGVDAPLDIAAFLARVFKLGPRALFRKPMRSVIWLGS